MALRKRHRRPGGAGVEARGGASSAAPAAGGEAGAAPRRIPFTVRMVIDRPAERRQVFEEAWRVMKNRFYDAKMHGVNWAAAKDRYESLLPNIADTEELHNVVMEMIGELNASHTGISGGGALPGEPQPERIQTRFPGFELAADSSGYYKVSRILHHGPADHEYVKLAPGNFILAVNGQELKTNDNYWRLFNMLSGRKFEFLVNAKPAADGAWTVAIEPLAAPAEANLEYDLWVENRKAMVERLTNGEIGYLHIKAMDAPSLVKFQEDLIDNRGKKALIIDERFNGGGGIDQELLEILNQRKEYQYTRGRDATVDVPRPVEAFFGPMVVMQNERSASRRRNVSGRLPRARAGQGGRRADHGRGDRHRRFRPARWIADSHPGLGRLHRRTAGTWRITACRRMSKWTTARPISLPVTTGRSRKPSRFCARR